MLTYQNATTGSVNITIPSSSITTTGCYCGSITTGTNLLVGSTTGVYYGTAYTQKTEIQLLGKVFEIELFTQNDILMGLAQIDFHGIGFYNSLKKMNWKINNEKIEKFLDRKLLAWQREQKIKEVIKD